MSIQNAEQARTAGLTFKEAKRLIGEFHIFNPMHILPPDRAQKYLDENWEGRMLDLKHFGFQERPRKKKFNAKNDSPATQS